MTNETVAPPITLEVADGTLSLLRGCHFRVAPQEWGTFDRMTIKDHHGADEDVAILGTGSQRTVKRLVLNAESMTREWEYRFVDVDSENQKRLLDTYKMFDGK